MIVGWDNTMPTRPGAIPGTLYLQVEDSAWGGGPDGEEVAVGDTEEEGLLVWVGQGVDDLIGDVQKIVKAAAPYGDIPLPIQVELLRDMDRDWPRTWQSVGRDLVAICRQSPLARMSGQTEHGKTYYLLLDESGWHLREWRALLEQGADYERTLASMVLTSESDRAQYTYADALASYVSDPSIMFRIHPSGLSLGLPVFAAFDRGVLLAGPVAIAGEAHGLSEAQVRLVGSEVLFVEQSVRDGVTSLWSHVWTTIGGRTHG